ncbi:armadillo-type protein [Rhizophagus irregularis DAOM 181602=DAOM 197198]|uniref:Importin-13 n=1 Tax=Rhizophagus irregularis (strain DAOM 181602 / DAOM 197198 / MUCL 43194) TaxID=747089 RepID=A0A2P4P6E5_RHIID|nr:armadillo-type protein [Rhizophagus irregularis DAOM 181602=DAOM 197198]POG60960.1 armadillo-type protein [Rhizophagus irregularis DAOM 181602=DAOM 197198]|eukprot:XP_025167826.1 armadillo-type protein [Rhizophagus irregularis DAOM 181602=DAOM 197198]
MDIQLAQVEQIIAQLYGNVDSNSAQEYLQTLQKQQYAWELAPQLLASESVNSQFFGAHTFQVKISRDWHTLPPDRKEWVRNELLRWIVRLSNGPMVVITKLCLALTAFALQAVPEFWTNFISDFLNYLHTESITVSAQNQSQPLFIELPLLEFLTVIPEEVLRADLIGERKARVNQELTDSIPRVMSILETLLSAHHEYSERDIILKQKCLRCLQSWIQYGVPFEMLHLLIDHVIALFSIESMNDAATEVLVEFISQTRINYYQNTVCEKILQCMTGDWAKSQITKAINDGDELSARNLCRLMTTFGDNFTNYVAINFLRQDIVIYLEMMLMFAGFPGYFGQDQEISEMPLQFWFMLQESLCDPEVIPVISASDNDVSTSDIQTLNISPTNIQQIRESSIVIFRRLIEVLRGKVQYPPDSEWVEFTKDVKERFWHYRRDVGDTILNTYYVLRDQMLAFLVELAISQISTPGRDQNQWQDLESTLFCIKSIAEAVSNGENIYLPQLFGSDVYGKLPVQGHTKLRNTAFSLIGSYADWFKSNPQYILSALNYLIPALSDIELALAAATAFKEVCDICRDSLVNGIEDLVNMYIVVGPNIQPREKQKVIESIADVIQVLPPEKMVQPLLSITSDIIQTMKDIILHGRQNPSQFREIIITQLEYLTCCGRGIQPPDENLIVIDDDDLKTKQNFAVFDSIPVQDLTNALSEIIRNIAEIWYQDNEVIECLCKFLNIGIRITPNLLSIPFEIIVPLIKISFQRHPHANWLETAVQIVTVYGSSPKHGVDLMDVLISLTSTTIQHVRSKAEMEQYPDIVNSYFLLITKFLKKCPLLLYSLPSDMFNGIMTFSVAGLGLQERLALKSAVNFIGEFIGQDCENDKFAKGIENVMMTYGLEIMRELLLVIKLIILYNYDIMDNKSLIIIRGLEVNCHDHLLVHYLLFYTR